MPTATTRKKIILNKVAVSLGCSSSCKKPKLSLFFHPKPKPKPKEQHYQKHPHTSVYNNSSSSYDTASGTTTFSPNTDTTPRTHYCDTPDVKKTRSLREFGRVGDQSVAVEKDSDDPYLDFRQSMLQMILENEIYSKDDLKELLNCFLQLNTPYYHGIIVRAFTEIWNGVFSVKSATAGSSSKLHYGHGIGFK